MRQICWFLACLGIFCLPGFAPERIAQALPQTADQAAERSDAAEPSASDAAPISHAQAARQAEIRHWIEELGSPSPALRDQAEAELIQLGAEAFDLLEAAETHRDPELAARARYLLSKIEFAWVDERDSERLRQLMEQYRRGDPDRRVEVINELFRLRSAEAVLALGRITRVERIENLSAYAGVAVLDLPWEEAPFAEQSGPTGPLRQAVLDSLQGSRHPGARWVIERLTPLSTVSPENLAKRLAAWSKLTQSLLEDPSRSPGQPDICTLTALLHHEWALAQHLQDQAGMENADRKLQRAYDGDIERWWAFAENYSDRLGHKDRAEREFSALVRVDKFNSPVCVLAASERAEMLHDMGKEDAAAQAFEPVFAAFKQDPALKERLAQYTNMAVGSMESRWRYFRGLANIQAGKSQEGWDEFQKGLLADATDADILIAMYQTANLDEEKKVAVREKIRAAAQTFEEQVLGNVDDPQAYNQYAWLIGNTEGDFDKAIRYSQKSIVLRARSGNSRLGGYYDTLAHCYLGKGDLVHAVENQRKAAELEPYSRQILHKLKLFETKLEEQQAQTVP